MHLSIHNITVLEGCISPYIIILNFNYQTHVSTETCRERHQVSRTRSCSLNSASTTTTFLQSSGKDHSLYGKMYTIYSTLSLSHALNHSLISQVEETLLKCCRTKEDETLMERPIQRSRKTVLTIHVDIIGDEFWNEHPAITQ